MEHCSNVKINGVTVDYDPLPMTQGAITAVSPFGLDFKINAGYDPPDYDGKGVGHIWVADGATRLVKPGSIDYGGPFKKIIPMGNGAYRLILKQAIWRSSVQVGDLIKIPQKLNLRSPHAIRIHACKSISLENVTIESAPCFGFVSTWGDNIMLDNVRVVPGPPPPGATEPRIFSSSADGINLQDDRRGPVIRNCIVACNGDDGIAIYNLPDMVLAQDGTSITIGLRCPDPQVECYSAGDTLRFFLHSRRRTVDRKIVSVQPGPPARELELIKETPKSSSHFRRAVKIILDLPLTVTPGDMLLNTKYAGRGFDISNNLLLNNACRGINVNESYGAVVRNYVYHTFLPGIHMTEFLEDGGSGFQTSVSIKDNTVIDACVGYSQRKDWQGAISIVTWDAEPHSLDGNSNITITGNKIDRPNGVGIQVLCGSKILIEDNIFGSLDKVGNAKKGAPAILLDEVYGANLRQNILVGTGWGTPQSELQVMRTCRDVSYDVPINFSFATCPPHE